MYDFHFTYLQITVILQSFLPLKLIAPCVVEKTAFSLHYSDGEMKILRDMIQQITNKMFLFTLH